MRRGLAATAAARRRFLTLHKALLGGRATTIGARVRTLGHRTHRARRLADAVSVAHVDGKLLALRHGHLPRRRRVLCLLQRVEHVTHISFSRNVWRVRGLATMPVDLERLALSGERRRVDLELTASAATAVVATTLLLDSATTTRGTAAARA